ncbi:MAG: ion transporter [Turneriella sp.]
MPREKSPARRKMTAPSAARTAPATPPGNGLSPWRNHIHEIVYEADTPAGRWFDLVLVVAIIASVLIIMLESVRSIEMRWHDELKIAEWFFTILFTLEYGLRLIAVSKPLLYARSFYGIVDLIAILPTWLSIFVPGAQILLSVRVLRLLRIFRILKLAHYLSQAEILRRALAQSRGKITVFLMTVTTIVIIVGSLMYVIEGEAHGFTSIPQSIYWAIVTLTTVGYGDISPKTPVGQAMASLVMIMGYGIIAVPTGIVTAELTQIRQKEVSGQACPACSLQGHDVDAVYCKHCGAKL